MYAHADGEVGQASGGVALRDPFAKIERGELHGEAGAHRAVRVSPGFFRRASSRTGHDPSPMNFITTPR